jgi:filamentous hemagglutinin
VQRNTPPGFSLTVTLNTPEPPPITLGQRRANHQGYVDDITSQLQNQGYTVKPGGARFYDQAVVQYTQTDIFAIRPNGQPMIIEFKTGQADLSRKQDLIYPQILDGRAIPSPAVADALGIDPGMPLNQAGFPNGIPIFVIRGPGL